MPSPMPRRLFDICFVPGLPAFASGRSDNPASPGPAGTSPVLGSGRGGRFRGSFPSTGSAAVNFLSGAVRVFPWLCAWFVSWPMRVLLAMIISFRCLALGLALKTHLVVRTFRFSCGGSITTKDYRTRRAHADRSERQPPAQTGPISLQAAAQQVARPGVWLMIDRKVASSARPARPCFPAAKTIVPRHDSTSQHHESNYLNLSASH